MATQDQDRYLALEQENALLRSRLQACEQSYVRLQAEITRDRQQEPDQPDPTLLSPRSDRTPEQRLWEATTAATNALLTIASFDEAVNTALQVIGEALETDRINIVENFIVENFDLPSDLAFPGWRSLGYEWKSPGTVPQHTDAKAAQGSYGDVPEFFEPLHQGQAISYFIEETPEPFRSAQRAIGVKSTHWVPIFVEGQWWGVLGLDDCREAKRRSVEELSVLKIVADCIGSAIQRQRSQQALLEAEQARVVELAKANEKLQQRDRLLSVVTQLTKDLLETEDVEVAIPAALQSVGEVANMSRVLLHIEQIDPTTQQLSHCVAYEWTAEGISDHKTVGLDVMHNDDYQILVQPLYSGKSIWHTIDDLPDVTRQPFERLDIQSTGVVPVFIEGRYIGCVAFDDCVTPRLWSQQEIDVLTAAAEIIGAALHRKRLVDRLVEERTEVAQEHAAELTKANEALKRSLDSLASEPSLDKFLGQVLTAIAEQFNSLLAEYWYHPENTAYIGMMSWQGRIYNRDEIAALYPNHLGVLGHQVLPEQVNGEPLQRRKQCFITEDWSTNPFTSYEQWYPQHGFYKEINVPMVLGDECIGALVVRLPRGYPITTQQIELAQALAHQATLVAQLMRLAEEAQQAAVAREQEKAAQERVTQLARANTTLKKTLDVLATEPQIDRSLGHVLQVLTEQLGSSSSALWLYNPDTQCFLLHLVYLNGDIIPAIPENIDRLTGQWIRDRKLPCDLKFKQHICDRKPVIYEVANFSESSQQFMQQLGVKTLLGIPLLLGSEIVGSFTVRFTGTRQFQAEELELTQALAHQATLAIQLTRLSAIAQHETQQAAILGERNRMARELHDTLAQTFTGIVMQLEATQAMIPPTISEPAQKHLHRAGLLARQGLQEARRSVWSLRSEALESADLPTALLRIAQQMTEHTTIQTDVIVDGTAIALPTKLENYLLRIGQEALTNALKHAQPQTIQIKLSFATDTVQLQIIDDGRGFDPQQQWRGFGITCMQERTYQTGGEFNLRSQIGQGTSIHVTIPLAPSEAGTS